MDLYARNTRHGRMLVPLKDRYIGASLDVYGEYSWGEVQLFSQIVKPGMWVLDVGANIGAFTIPLSQMVGDYGHVVAFEPQPQVFDALRLNCDTNRCANVVLMQTALGAAAGTIRVPDVDYENEGNFGGVSLSADIMGEDVPLVTIDGLNLPTCHFIKLDVEGMEIEALRGAEATISRHRPVLYVENDRVEKSRELIALLEEFGYRLFWHTPPLFNPDNFAGERSNLWPGMVSVNMLCVPHEYDVDLTGFEEVDGPDDRPACLKGRE